MEDSRNFINEPTMAPQLDTPVATLSQPTSPESSHCVHRHLQAVSNTIMSLRVLCERIPQFAVLDRLKIVSSECYVTRTLVQHRYLILELRNGRKSAWMRLDRRRPLTHILSFFLRASGGPANDTVVVSLEKTSLIDENSTQENRQECSDESTVTLGEMRHFFALLIRELTHYRLHDANCWLFASTIQHYLQHQANAKMVSGRIVKSNWALKTRSRVLNALQNLYHLSTTPIMLTDLRERLEACINHPLFMDYDQEDIVPVLRKGIAAIEQQSTANQQHNTITPDLSMELHSVLDYINHELPISLMGSLAEIAIVLAGSSQTMSLALPAALRTKAQYLDLSGASETQPYALWRQSLAIVREWRQQPLFVQEHREVCEIVYGPRQLSLSIDTSELADEIRSALLTGIETERYLIEKSPRNCVSHCVHELERLARYLDGQEEYEEACGVWISAIQLAQSCKCISHDRDAESYTRIPYLMSAYADSLMKISRIEDSLEQYQTALDEAFDKNYSYPYDFPKFYSNALLAVGRTEESYDTIHECVKDAEARFSSTPSKRNYLDFIDLAKLLSRHLFIQDDYDLQLQMLSNILSRLRRDSVEYDDDDYHSMIAGVLRETLWDYANTLAIVRSFQLSEEAFAELVQLWREGYEAEWDDDGRPAEVVQWYFVALDMYAKILEVGGKVTESRAAREVADSISLQHALSTPVLAERLKRLEWKLQYDENDPEYPPQLICSYTWPGKARPAALLPISTGRIQRNLPVMDRTTDGRR